MTTGSAPTPATAPHFEVNDLDRSVAYYRDRLGFKLDFIYQLFFASLSRDGLTIQLKAASLPENQGTRRRQFARLDAHLPVNDIDALFQDFVVRGARIVRQLEKRPWGTKEFFVEDPDGHILCFTEKKH
jgi:catechol 2,3-dioxygenase-like lactoylglutathione lyase family enzyme